MGSISASEQNEIRKIAQLEKTVALQGKVLRELLEILRHSKIDVLATEHLKLVNLLSELSPK